MFANAVKLFTINGFDIKLDPSWALIAALITWSLSRQYFPHVFPGQSIEVYLAMALAAMLCFFASLLLHELAHSVVARRLGTPIKGITLFVFGGVAEMEAEPNSATAEFWIALAGPAMSLVLSFGFWMLAQFSTLYSDTAVLTEVLAYLAIINLILALFNLVPAFPLDGGRVLRAVLWHRNGDILKATETAARSGAIIAYVLMGLGVLALFQEATVTGLWQIMIGVYILIAARSGYQAQLARVAFEDKFVGALMARNPVVVSPALTLAECVNQVMLRYGVRFLPVLDDGVLLGHIDQNILFGIDRENWSQTRVDDVFVGLNDAHTVAPDMPVQDLMSLISQTGQRKFLVVENDTLVGVITLADLMHYLQVSDMFHRR